ncbi:hypothetical protein U8V72_14965 [Priestia filamentosa]|uniref:hypothetical protein n=1 Tax=Priestia filamentosa TaxID=1402861 RepID=UPI00397C4302
MKKGLSVQFFSNAVSMTYIEKQLCYVQRKKTTEEQLEETIGEMVENLRIKVEETHMDRVDTFVTLPHEKVRTYSMLQYPNFQGLKGQKLNQALQLHLEDELELKLNKPIYYYHTFENENNRLMTVSVVEEDEISIYPHLLFEKKFNLKKIQLESDSIREYAINNSQISKEETSVFVHFFFDGEERQVGFYVYKGDFLAAIRYLPMDYYDYKTLKSELDVVISDCAQKIEGFFINTYCIISDDEKDYHSLNNYYQNGEEKLLFLKEKYPASKGVLQIVNLDDKGGKGYEEFE